MGLKMGHHFTAPLMSGPHQFPVYTFNISVEKSPLILTVCCIHALCTSVPACSFFVCGHNESSLTQYSLFSPATHFQFLYAVYNTLCLFVYILYSLNRISRSLCPIR